LATSGSEELRFKVSQQKNMNLLNNIKNELKNNNLKLFKNFEIIPERYKEKQKYIEIEFKNEEKEKSFDEDEDNINEEYDDDDDEFIYENYDNFVSNDGLIDYMNKNIEGEEENKGNLNYLF
jgi:hypothetical protein